MPPGLYLHRSNQLEALSLCLAGLVRQNLPADPLEPVTIVVQTPGVSRWLSMRMADSLGCCMNMRYLFPRNFVAGAAKALLQRPLDLQAEEDTLMWRIHGLLPSLANEPLFEPLARYLADGRPLKRIQLAERLARLFDQYQVYRPEMVVHWERGREREDWQAELWRRITAGAELPHLAGLFPELRAADPPAGALPASIYLFGISTLPPLYLDFLSVVGLHSQVHLLSLDPGESYWGDLRTRRKRLREEADAEVDEYAPQNGLLAALGRQGQEFSELVIDANFNPLTEDFRPPGRDTILHALQDNVLQLRNFQPGEVFLPDASLQLANCHGPMREVEALRDHLLHLLDTVPGLRTRDILVLAPNIDSFAPYVHAVFGCTKGSHDHLPYSVADRGQREAELADAFLAVLGLAGRRKTAQEVLALLEHPAIRTRFGFDDAELETVRRFARETGIRWGFDAAHRQSLGLPPIRQNSWQAGIDSLLLGTLMLPGEEPWNGIVPYDQAEGDALPLIGRLSGALSTLRRSLLAIEQPRPLAGWPALLRDIVHDFLPDEKGSARERMAVLEGIAALAEHATEAGEAPVDAQSIHYLLEGSLRRYLVPHGFLSGAVTFAELKPMRSVPSRVICLLGMDESSFPRHDRPLSFDKMARSPKLGDRSQRTGDRYLFLETLLSAREHLYISYSGQSLHGQAEAPPSVVVQELLEHLRPAMGGELDGLVTKHPLQPFSRRYFTADSGLFSYSRDNLAAAIAGLDQRTARMPEPLPPPSEESATVPLDRLGRFLVHPVKFFLEQRLGLRLPHDDDPFSDHEPDAPAGLELYSINQEMLDRVIDGRAHETVTGMQARGALPWGEIGTAVHRSLTNTVRRFHSTIAGDLSGPTHPTAAAELKIQGRHARYTLQVPATQLRNGLLLTYRVAKLKSKDCLRAWLHCLAWSAVAQGLAGVKVICKDRSLELPPHPAPLPLLADLLDLYWEGHLQALPFFPDASLAAASTDSSNASPLQIGFRRWRPDRSYPDAPDPESEDAWNHAAFPHDEPFEEPGAQFLALAERVWRPYLQHLEAQR